MQRSHRYFTVFLAILLGVGLLLMATGTASAHAKVLSATPGIGSTVATAPTTVTVETAENINPDAKLSNLFVYGPSGELISQGDATVSLSKPREMSVQIKPEANGTYIVRWITTSAEDNEADEGAFFFKVEPTTAKPQTPAPTTPTANNSTPFVPIAIASIVALLVGLGAGFGIGQGRTKSAVQTAESAGASQTPEQVPTKPKS